MDAAGSVYWRRGRAGESEVRFGSLQEEAVQAFPFELGANEYDQLSGGRQVSPANFV